MKKTLLVPGLAAIFGIASCGPAAENREAMHIRAKVFQDSIATVIRTSMNEAAAPAPGRVMVPDTAKKMTTPISPPAK